MQHTHNLLHTQGAVIQKISSAHNIKGNFHLYSNSASVEDFTYVDYKKKFSQSISEIPTICTHRVGFCKSWRKRRLRNENPNKLGTRNEFNVDFGIPRTDVLSITPSKNVGSWYSKVGIKIIFDYGYTIHIYEVA